MRAIFFDLETSTKLFIGQILNYSFLVTNSDFKVVDELSGEIKLSRLQLPDPEAILANKTDVIKHQALARLTEKLAALEIAKFIQKQINIVGGKIPIIGYNSSLFDIPYLRTTFIRNGINPYFQGGLINRDLVLLSRKLSCTEKKFPRFIKDAKSEDQDARISLSLETLAQSFDLLTGAQTHFSRDDVLVTIELAKLFYEKFGIDIRTFEAYEMVAFHKQIRTGSVIYARSPEYNPDSKSISVVTPYALLDADYRYALWIDLNAYKKGEGAQSIRWFNTTTRALFLGPEQETSLEDSKLAKDSLKEFSTVNLKNFFPPSICDIEQDIYRLDMPLIDALSKAIWQGDETRLKNSKNKDAQVLLTRFKLANLTEEACHSPEVQEKLNSYFLYRYSEKSCLTSKKSAKDILVKEDYHPSFAEMKQKAELLSETCSDKDRKLLDSLLVYYNQFNRFFDD